MQAAIEPTRFVRENVITGSCCDQIKVRNELSPSCNRLLMGFQQRQAPVGFLPLTLELGNNVQHLSPTGRFANC